MTVDPAVVPGFLLLLAELAALAAVGYVVVRVALRQTDDRMALAQGMVVGLALWGVITNFALYVAPGLAGAAVGWGVTLGLGALLVWRAPERIRPEPRVLAGFAVAVLALWWIGLAGRQLLVVGDAWNHVSLSAWIRAGGFPPELPWNPGVALRYHHAVDLLAGLLAPPFGPDMAFTWELLGVYGWVSFALVVVTALMRWGSWWTALLLAPLMLTYGLWTWEPAGPGLVQGPAPAGLPAAGLRASLADIYWPTVGESFSWEHTLPDIWKPSFTLAYALTVVVLERVAHGAGRTWPAALTLAGLVGFLGLLSMTLTPVVVVLWAGLETVRLGKSWRARGLAWRDMLRPGAGLALAAVALLLSGGRFTGILDGSGSLGMVWWWDGGPGDWRVLGVFAALPGGVGLVALGPVAVAGLAAGLAWRDRLVLALAVGVVLLVAAWLVLRYEPRPVDINRLTGHARNLALVALLLALSGRLAGLRPRWRYAVGALLVGLVIWPTSATQARNVGMALGQGIEVANARWARSMRGGDPAWGRERTVLPEVSAPIAAYIRGHTAVDARVLVPEPTHLATTFDPEPARLAVTYATGRPNGTGYINVAHLAPHFGPEYLDACDYLEPGAMRRLGIDYVYATDEWIAGLPDRARDWLADPELFELVLRDGAVTLYGVRPAFLALDVTPTPASYEALRRAAPAGAKVYWPDGAPFETDTTLRVASALSPEAELYGALKFPLRRVHAMTSLPAGPLGARTPDLVILPVGQQPWMFPPAGRQPIWWNEEMAIYAPHGAVAPVMTPLDPAPPPEPPPIGVRVSDVREADGQLAFTLTVDDHSPDRWTGQDWVVVSVDASPWAIPRHLDNGEPVIQQWFGGQMVRGRGLTTHGLVYDARAPSLAVRGGDGGFWTPASSVRAAVGPGNWMLVLRVLRAEDRDAFVAQEQAAMIPVLKFTVSPDGEVSYEVYDDLLGP